MAVVRWDPFHELTAMQERLNRLFGEAGRRTDDDLMMRGEVVFPVDIYQNDRGELVLAAELPGLRREEIDLRVENQTLTIKGERRMPAEIPEGQFLRRERSYGSFSRSFSVPNSLDIEKIRADYRDGLLTVVLPTREEAKPRQVQVQIG